ncbi:tubulin/FtsZ family protein [Haloarchaeobius baliensis]|uniref:tubulin/FtsZ family protein n=1 Tax=Haloarchaeobius baliensis TaxID=1670458 RepID=UPI003F8815F9
MKLAMIGFGQAGGKVVDRFVEFDRQTRGKTVRAAIAVNTAEADLRGVKHIPKDRQVLIGQTRVKGHGVGADNELGAEVAEEDIEEIQAALDDVPVHEVDAFMVVAGLGGGTGSGGAPVLAKHLKRLYAEPVYGLGILPGSDEGGLYTLNAARSFQTFVREVDNLIVFDNESWRHTGESLGEGYAGINEELVRRLAVLFGAGEVDDGGAVGESVVDASEIINTLGSGGVSTIGYAVDHVEREKGGLFSRFSKKELDETDTTNRITSLVRKAALGRLTLPCELNGVERGLLVTAGPPEYLNRKGIEHGRRWLEEQTGSMEIRGGDYPLPDEHSVACVVLLSGVTDVPRIKGLQQVAIEAMDNLEEIRSQSDANLEALLDDGDEELTPLF